MFPLSGHALWRGAAIFCWLVILWLVVVPVSIDVGNGVMEQCSRLFHDALYGGDSGCAEHSRNRVHTLVVWTVLTAPVTLGFLTRDRRVKPAE